MTGTARRYAGVPAAESVSTTDEPLYATSVTAGAVPVSTPTVNAVTGVEVAPSASLNVSVSAVPTADALNSVGPVGSTFWLAFAGTAG